MQTSDAGYRPGTLVFYCRSSHIEVKVGDAALIVKPATSLGFCNDGQPAGYVVIHRAKEIVSPLHDLYMDGFQLEDR